MAKKIPLKKVNFTDSNIQDALDYKEQVIMALQTPTNPQGIDYAEMAEVVPLLDKVKQCTDDELLLEDAEHDVVVRHLRAVRFRLVVPEVFEMMREIIEAPKIDLKAVKEG